MNRVKLIISAVMFLILTGCNHTNDLRSDNDEQEILFVHKDGSMFLNERRMPSDDVIIYSAEQGIEKAAIKVYVPYHPPYYRDSIIVERHD